MSDRDFKKAFQSKILETFQVLIKVIEQNNLNYFVCGGTAIGAVRHNNIIPWDDDIDIFMPRKDYMKLIELANCIIPKGYKLRSIYDQEGLFTYAKFINENTSFWEIENYPVMSGIFVDVFPVDESSLSKKEFYNLWKQRKKLVQILFLSQYKFNLGYAFNGKNIADKKMYLCNLLSLFVPRCISHMVRKKLLRLDRSFVCNENCEHAVCYYGSYGCKEYFEAAWFKSYSLCKYADFEVRICNGNHEYLSNTYGDYMKLPPEGKRVYEHRHHYVNLSSRISIEEAKKRIKAGKFEEI